MERGFLLGLDVGTTRIKAVVIDAAGVEWASASVPTPFASSTTGIDMAVADLGRALGTVLVALGAARERVVAVGVAGMAESGAPMRDGRALAYWSGTWLPSRQVQWLRDVKARLATSK